MKEIGEILSKVERLGAGERAVLATVVDLKGSGYRLPGARMLITSDVGTVGTVSGGCLEADVLERSNRVLAGGRPEIFTYDTTGDENSVFSMNMGCRGVIRILLESVEAKSLLIERLRLVRQLREPQFMMTLISGDHVGARAFLDASSGYEPAGVPGIFNDRSLLENALRDFGNSGIDQTIKSIETPDGILEFALERISPPLSLLLFGAGADAVPLARLANELGWEVTVYDHRPAYLTSERFPLAKDLKLISRDQPIGSLPSDSLTVVVIMTHDYARDLDILPAALGTDAFYIGLLGPKSRTKQLLNEVAANARAADPERLYAPIGLDIGGHTPEGIALAIAAEIQAVLGSRSGGHLRERQGSIYGRG